MTNSFRLGRWEGRFAQNLLKIEMKFWSLTCYQTK